ncbi:putative c6 transcription protein [Botrytis fragariae]|uniref:Putative c6 transcription protein n=1 Tax=Botrytis fragariae TaxID=1964551 RepID=A0A8H6AQZ5_9HELO|nr:putative c6 transcription protein [Botrytis fragariae]KAF5871888.1 putative c6 transcription protein [Botrytis fragariae]
MDNDVTRPDKMFSSSRRSHRKTRTGCNNCKRRKIKCGEGKPSCLNCIKHSVQCDYSKADAATSAKNTPLSSPGSSTSVSAPNNVLGRIVEGQDPYLNLMDLEVFNNFVVSTSNSLNSNPVVRKIYQTTIVEIALRHEFVMRALLALSALHMARNRPDRSQQLHEYSKQQHEAALRQGTAFIPHITTETCAALHVFSIFTGMHTLGRPRSVDEFVIVGDNGITSWLVLFRGVTAIIDQFKDALLTGPLNTLFKAREERVMLRQTYADDEVEHLGHLRIAIETTVPDEHEVQIYTEAIRGLELSYQFMYKCPAEQYETGDIFIWLFRVPDEYLSRLNDGTQEALAILAYSVVCFRKLENLWWIEGWSNHLMANIYQFLDEEHRQWVQAPIDEIGWVPYQ